MSEVGGRREEDRRQKTDDRRQLTEDRGQRFFWVSGFQPRSFDLNDFNDQMIDVRCETNSDK